MRRLLRTLLVCLILFISLNRLSAQSSLSIGVNADAGNKWFQPQDKRGYGVSLEYVPIVRKNGGLRLVVGYDWFELRVPKNVEPQLWQDSMKIYGALANDISLVPIRIGYEQLFWKAVVINGEIGVAHLITTHGYSGSKNLFSYSFGLGYRIYLKDKNYFQLSCNYNYNRLNRYQQLNYLSFRLAYGFHIQHVKK